MDGEPIVNAPTGLMSEMVTKKECGPSRASSIAVSIDTQSLRGNVLPLANVSMYGPAVKSVESTEK